MLPKFQQVGEASRWVPLTPPHLAPGVQEATLLSPWKGGCSARRQPSPKGSQLTLFPPPTWSQFTFGVDLGQG